jgi:hypothetical protein
LLKQADAALEQAKALCNNLDAANPANSHKVPLLGQALKEVQAMSDAASKKINEVDGHIAELKRDAEQRADETYGS